MKENRLQRNIRMALEDEGAYVLPLQPGEGYLRRGEPDLVGCWQSWAFALECKTPTGGEPTPIQKHRLTGWVKAGARVGVPRSVADARAIVMGGKKQWVP